MDSPLMFESDHFVIESRPMLISLILPVIGNEKCGIIGNKNAVTFE